MNEVADEAWAEGRDRFLLSLEEFGLLTMPAGADPQATK